MAKRKREGQEEATATVPARDGRSFIWGGAAEVGRGAILRATR